MNAFQLNKIAMAVLGIIFVIMGISILSESFFHSEEPKVAGYEIKAEEKAPEAKTEANANAKPYEDIAPLLASADLEAGAKVSKKCGACHTFEKGGKNKVGPHLYDIVGRAIAGVDDFGYSSALKAYGDGKTWTYEELNGFLYKPKKHVKGTAMGFSGLKKTADRANLIGWLRTHSDAPVALPGT